MAGAPRSPPSEASTVFRELLNHKCFVGSGPSPDPGDAWEICVDEEGREGKGLGCDPGPPRVVLSEMPFTPETPLETETGRGD